MRALFTKNGFLSIVLVLSLLASAFFAATQVAVVSGGSMEPAYHEGDRVLVERFLWRVAGLEVGDVVVLEHPQGRGSLDLKRVSDTPAEAGTYYLLGDNLRNSTDSREWGSVPKTYIVGRVILKL